MLGLGVVRDKVTGAAKSAVLWIAVGITALVGIAFVVAGIYLTLAAAHGAPFAALMTGGGLLGLALILAVIAMLLSSRRRQREAERPPLGQAFLAGLAAGQSVGSKFSKK